MNIKRILVLLLSLVLMFSLTACGKDSVVVLQNVYDALIDDDGNLFQDAQMEKGGKTALETFYYINESDLEDYLIYMDTASGQAAEVALFEVKDESTIVTIKSLLQDRQNDLKTRFEEYNPTEVSKIENAAIISNGKYIGMVICKDGAKAKEILKNNM